MLKLVFTSYFVLITVNRKHFGQAQTSNPPLNAAANVGDRVVINCTTTSASMIPQWRYSPTGSGPLTDISYIGSCDSLIPTRFVVESTGNGNCNLIIPNATTAEALSYQCEDGRGFTRAMLLTILESVEVSPNSTDEEPCAGDPLNITCSVKYSAVRTTGYQMFPSIMWTNLSGNSNTSGITPSPVSPNVTTSYLGISVTPPTVPSYRCNVYFNAPSLPLTYATNAPIYYKSTSTKKLTVQYLNNSANITSNVTSPCVNETALLTCEVNGYPMPSYIWRNADTNETISNTIDVVIDSGGNYVCLASSSACNSTTTLQKCNCATTCATCSPAIGTLITYVGNAANGRLILTCNASGLPAPMYEWTTGDRRIGDSQELAVSEVENYTCTAYNFIHGVRHTDNYTISITEIVVVQDNPEDETIIIIIVVVSVCGWIGANLFVSGISFAIYRKHKVIMNGKFSWLKKMMPCANTKDKNVDDPLCQKILWVSLCLVTSVFVAVIVYPILFAIAGCPCCRKSRQETRNKRSSRNESTGDHQSGASPQSMSNSTVEAPRQAAPPRPDSIHLTQVDPYRNSHVNYPPSRPPPSNRAMHSPSPVSASAVEYGELKIDSKPGSRKPLEPIIQNESAYAELHTS